MTSSADLTFVHLSDIHFRKGIVGTKHDPDALLRDELERDLRELVPRFGPISGIIITGDVAWSGHKSEYRYAESWIQKIAEHLQCSVSGVMVIPGNHDVNRGELEKDGARIAKLQRRVRKGANPAKTSSRLAGVLSGEEGPLLTAPLRAYNAFAKRYSCAITPQDPYWERSFKLGDGTTLLIRGITSTWLSGPGDSERVARLLYGSGQYTFRRLQQTQYIAAAHHPPQNMIDGEDAAQAFESDCRLQLFGHKHNQWITQSKTSARIIAGAFQPDRREAPWIPRYNVLEIAGELTDKARLLQIRVYPRRWSDEFRRFMADFTPDAADVRAFEFFTA
jgi:hypothetical protein